MSILKKKRWQRGDSLLLSIFILLLMTLGLVASMRTVTNDAQASGALSWHTRGKQASEVALKETLANIAEAASNGQLATSSPIWLRTALNAGAPTPTYWVNCWDESTNTPNSDSTLRCNKTVSNGFRVYSVVQSTPAVATGTASACFPHDAQFYRIFIHAVEISGRGSQVDTEAIYRLCV